MKRKRLIIITRNGIGRHWEDYSFAGTVAGMTSAVVYGLIKIFQFMPSVLD